MSNPNPRPLKSVRDLRDDTWMVREGLAEIEREQVLRNGSTQRYELSKIPYLGTDGSATMLDLVPHPKKIYEDDSDYIKACKRGGSKNLIWWHPDFPIDGGVADKSRKLLRPKPVEWSLHPASLLPNPYENFAKTRKLPLTSHEPAATKPINTHEPTPRELRLPGRTARLDAVNMLPATGAPREYSWEPSLKKEGYNFYKLITNGYLPAHLHETRKRNYFESLLERPQNAQEKLQDQIFHEQRAHNQRLRDTAQRFDRMTRGLPSWTEREHLNNRKHLFPQGWGRGVRAPPVENKCPVNATEGLAH